MLSLVAALLTNDTEQKRTWITTRPKVKTVDDYWIEKCRQPNAHGLISYITFLSDGERMPRKIQKQWINAFFSSKLSCVVGFPGCGKTTLIEDLLCWYIGLFPDRRNSIISITEDQASKRLENVRSQIMYQERFKAVFPWIQEDRVRPNNTTQLNLWSTKWRGSKNDITYAGWRSNLGKYGNPRDHTLMAAGVGSSKVQGARFDGLVAIDDVHDEKNSATKEQRDKVFLFMTNTLMARLTGKYAKVFMIANTLHPDDVPNRIKEQEKESGEKIWNYISTPIIDKDNNPTFPEVYDMEKVIEIAETHGAYPSNGFKSPSFNLTYRNDTKGSSHEPVTKEMVSQDIPDECKTQEFVRGLKHFVVSTDFAHTKNEGSDFTVYSLIGFSRDKRPKFYIYEQVRFKEGDIEKKIEKLADFVDMCAAKYGRMDYVYMENKDSRPEEQTLAKTRKDIPCKVIVTKGDKERRFRNLKAYLQTMDVFINQKMPTIEDLKSEFMDFPKVKHDDIVDSCDLPLEEPSWNVTAGIYAKKRTISVGFI